MTSRPSVLERRRSPTMENSLFLGEKAAQSAAHNEVEALNPQTNTWRSLAPLNLGRHATQAIVDNGAIYIAAGSKTKGLPKLIQAKPSFRKFIK